MADVLGIPFDKVQQACLSPLAFTKGTDFKPAARPDRRHDHPLGPVVSLDPALRAPRTRRQGVHAAPTRATRCTTAAVAAGAALPGLPFLEVGSYCGRSTVWLGGAARACGTVLFAVDHHRGSEENQAGWEHHDTSVVDPRIGQMDTLPPFRGTIHDAGLEDVGRRGRRPVADGGRALATPLAFLFIDGGHGDEPARLDYERLDARTSRRRHAGHPRRVPRPGRRRPAAVRADLPAGAGQWAVRPCLGDGLAPSPALHACSPDRAV